MKNKNSGFAHMALILILLAAIVAVVMVFSLKRSPIEDPSQMDNRNMSSPIPISESTDIETLEMELDQTTIGDFEVDVNELESEASGL